VTDENYASPGAGFVSFPGRLIKLPAGYLFDRFTCRRVCGRAGPGRSGHRGWTRKGVQRKRGGWLAGVGEAARTRQLFDGLAIGHLGEVWCGGRGGACGSSNLSTGPLGAGKAAFRRPRPKRAARQREGCAASRLRGVLLLRAEEEKKSRCGQSELWRLSRPDRSRPPPGQREAEQAFLRAAARAPFRRRCSGGRTCGQRKGRRAGRGGWPRLSRCRTGTALCRVNSRLLIRRTGRDRFRRDESSAGWARARLTLGGRSGPPQSVWARPIERREAFVLPYFHEGYGQWGFLPKAMAYGPAAGSLPPAVRSPKTVVA